MRTNPEKPATEHPREALKAELRVYYGKSQEKILYGFSVDMSCGGLFLKTETPFSVDEKVMLSFTLPDTKKIVNCVAKVAWVNSKDKPKKTELPPGIGLQFLDLSADYVMAIQSLLQHGGIDPINERAK